MSYVDRLIEEAMGRGEFDDLPGEGRPLPPLRPSDELAARLLQEQGFTLPWIEQRRQIEADLATARARLAGHRHVYPPARRGPGWARAVRAFARQLEDLNRKIRDYNLSVPLPRFQRPLLDLRSELGRLETRLDQPEGERSRSAARSD